MLFPNLFNRKMNKFIKKNIQRKNIKTILKLKFLFVLFLLILDIASFTNNLHISKSHSIQNQKYWVGGKYKILINKYLDNNNGKIILKYSKKMMEEISNGFMLMKSNGKECFTVYTSSKKNR